MATTTRGIIYPVVGDTLTPLANHFANLATSTDTAITNAMTSGNQQFYGTAANLAGLTGMKLGDTYQETDGNKILWKYDGSNWVTNEGGMYLIRPTAPVGATVDASGALIPSGAAGVISVNNVFTSRFRSYRVLGKLVSSSVGQSLDFRFRASGADITTASYRWQAFFAANGTPIGPIGNGDTKIQLQVGAPASNVFDFTVFDPSVAGLKGLLGSAAMASGLGFALSTVGGGLDSATSTDGFSIIASAANFAANGYLKIYGLA